MNLENEVGAKLKEKAAAENRSASNYIELLVEQDLRASGLLPENGTGIAVLELVREAQTAGVDVAAVLTRAKARAGK